MDMNMNLTVTLTASPIMLEVFKLLAGSANQTTGIITMPSINAAPRTEAPKNVVNISPNREDNETARPGTGTGTETTATVATTTQSDLTVEQVRAATQAKAKSGKRSEVKALLSKYGTDSVTNMDAANYAAFYAELEAL